jgi:hypothetical protein
MVISFGCKKEAEKKRFLDLTSLKIPYYSNAESVHQGIDKNKLKKTILYSVAIPYPEKNVLDFYDIELSKLGFKVFLPKMYSETRKWSLLYDIVDGKKHNNAQLDAFWINENKHFITWLALFTEWNQETDNTKNMQWVKLDIKTYNEGEIERNIDMFELFSDPVLQKHSAPNLNEVRTNLEGEYSLGNEIFEFKNIKLQSNDIKDTINYLKLSDLKGEVFYVENKTIISSEDIDNILVEKILYKPVSSEKIENNNTNEAYQMFFNLKKNLNKKFKIIKNSRVGLINRDKILISAFVTEELNSDIKLELGEKKEMMTIINRLKLKKR